ncbi:hypothetical protein OsI_06278 [Oryza sativa Indica Group]|uniref:SHSP domain-containing protein n=1 Tax=Oryza sativa subsp. indica TaxID=39946 RepID=B8ADT8_ORYSI|nr:hypothetical protein OsI_06278 [Oryza sativa Indica Group]
MPQQTPRRRLRSGEATARGVAGGGGGCQFSWAAQLSCPLLVGGSRRRRPPPAAALLRKAAVTAREVAVVDRSRRRWPWRDLRDFVPLRLVDGIGSALSQVAETLTRPLTGKVREDEERYRLRFEVPGLGKDDVRVYVDDGVLAIHGEKRDVVEEDRGRDGDGECWAAATYHAGLLLPEDAVAEGITAEVRDGVLHVTVPRSPERKRSVTEVKVR